MGFADDLINKKKKKQEDSDFVNQVINGTYKVNRIDVKPDFGGFTNLARENSRNKTTTNKTTPKVTQTISLPSQTMTTNNDRLNSLLSERNRTIYSPITRNNSLNNSALNISLQSNKLDEINQQAEQLKNYSKNDEIQKLSKENYEDKGLKLLVALDRLRRQTPQEKLETTLKTTGNAITNTTHGAGKALENFYDFSLNASNNVNTALEEAFGIKSKEEAARSRQQAADIIKRDLVTEAENKLGWTDELRNEWEKNSLIKRNNIGGQVFQGIGQMLPTIFVGNAMGGLPQNATKVQKLISSIPTTETLGTSSYGGALEEAYNEGATTSQANKYALGSMLTEVTTEWLTGGIPGVNNAGILDNLEEKTLNKVSNNMAKFLIKEGYNVVGEGTEEALAEIIKPYLKNATYTQGQKINWNDVMQSAIVGGITGGVLDAPGNMSEYRRTQTSQQQAQPTIPQKLPTASKTTLDNINIPTTQNISQNGLNVPINENINANQNNDINLPTVDNTNPIENPQKFSQRQEQVRNQQVQKDTNRRITLEEQLEKQGNRILEESESQKKAMIDHFKEYLEENNINNPTQKDIDDAIVDNLIYDNELDATDTKKMEQLYNQYAKEYMKENGIPFNNGDNIKQQQSDISQKNDLTSSNIENAKKETTLPSKTTTEVKKAPSEPKIPSSKDVETKVEKPKEIVKLSNEEDKELKTLKEIDDAFGLEPEEEARKQLLEKKQQGYVERFPGLKKVKDFKEISKDYGKYKDLSNFDNKLLKEAEGIIPSYRDTGRRTKEQWLEVAKYIGNNFKGNSSENLTKYAIQSWFDAQPNQKDTLNRQGSKYVDFKIQDWINEIYDGARIGELEKPLVPTTQVVQPKKEQVSLPAAKNDDVIKVSNDIAKQINNTGGFNLKQRSWIETSTESDALKGKVLIEDLDPGKINYVVQSNKKSLDTANRHLNTYGYEKSLADVKSMLRSDGLPKASDVALMQRMIQEASKRGDAATVQDLIMDTAILGTDLGQATQALSMIKRLTPEGQLTMYTKLVERAKARGEKSFQNVEITPEMVQNILEAYNKDGTYNQDDLNARVEKFKQDIANQMKSTVGDKIDAWRYLSMLGNPKTHIRNMVSNIAMTETIKVKNAMARTLETILPIKERTKTWKPASKDVKEFAKQTANNMKDIITGEAKYNEKSAIESKKQIFKNKTLEKLSNFNSNALEAEDWFFSKRAFQSTLQEYLTAKGINTYEDIKNNPELVEKAKNYAVEQAEIATFRQYSKLASMINQIERKNKGAKLAIQALVPFKKTPINVAKAGVSYSPLGLLKTISYDTYQLKQGNINASQYIDNISQGLTGTSLTLLGYALAKAGILSGSGGDDKEDKYDQQLGNTGYSIKAGGKSYSISWLSPVAMPMLVGANAYEQLEEGKSWDMNVVSDSLAKTLDPLNEMSFMQGVTNALNSYSSGVDKWKGIAESTVQNYVGQFFPTLFSQIASTTDDTKRSTKASSNSTYKFGEQTVRSIMYKIPGLRQQLEPATDIWGNEKKQSTNILERAFDSFLAPYSKTKDISTNLDKEIKRVYNETGETGVIPSIPYGYTKYDGETYKMSAKEYTEYKKTYGNTANTTLNTLIKSDDYKEASDEDKAKMIDNVYDYARAKANQEYFDSIDVDYSNKTLEKLDSLKDMFGISASTYYANKKEYDYAYQYPEKYRTVTQIAPYDKYTKYKDEIDDIRNNTSNDKEETIKYINSLNMSVPQKAMFIKQYYKSFKQYDKEIIEYVNGKNLTSKEKEQVLGQLGFTIRDGRVYY